MVSRTILLNVTTTRLRDSIAPHSHAMPFGLGKLRLNGGIDICCAPVFVFADTQSVPISRGSPPTPS